MNNLERLTLYMLVAILYFALMFLTDLPNAAKYTLGLLLTLANLALVGYLLLKFIQELWLCILWTIDSEVGMGKWNTSQNAVGGVAQGGPDGLTLLRYDE